MRTLLLYNTEWTEIPFYDGYYASRDGRIGSLWVLDKNARQGGELILGTDLRILHPRPTKKGGYRKVNVKSNDGKRRDESIHTLIAVTFLGPKPKGMWCLHENGNNADNRIQNLRYATPKESEFIKKNRGTSLKGEQIANAKLSAQQVLEIRKRKANGENTFTLASEFNVHPMHINRIARGEAWSWLTSNDARS